MHRQKRPRPHDSVRAVPQSQVRSAPTGRILPAVCLLEQRPRGLDGHLYNRAADAGGQSHATNARPGGRPAPHHPGLAGAHEPMGRFRQREPAGMGHRALLQRRRQRGALLFLRRRLDPRCQLRADQVDRSFPRHEQSSIHRRLSARTIDRSEPALRRAGPVHQRHGSIERIQGRGGRSTEPDEQVLGEVCQGHRRLQQSGEGTGTGV